MIDNVNHRTHAHKVTQTSKLKYNRLPVAPNPLTHGTIHKTLKCKCP
jgi:hypothetical protein